MANPHEGQAALVVGDRTYTLKATARAMATMEKVTGKPTGALLSEIEKGSFSGIAAILQSCASPAMSEEQAFDAIEACGLEAIGNALGEMFAASGLFGGAANPPTGTA